MKPFNNLRPQIRLKFRPYNLYGEGHGLAILKVHFSTRTKGCPNPLNLEKVHFSSYLLDRVAQVNYLLQRP